jgi:hypothetical protein
VPARTRPAHDLTAPVQKSTSQCHEEKKQSVKKDCERKRETCTAGTGPSPSPPGAPLRLVAKRRRVFCIFVSLAVAVDGVLGKPAGLQGRE